MEWEFVKEMMKALGFPSKFIAWIMQCITTPQYSIKLNGGVYESIKRRRELRQGDPVSPLLFVICMEYLSRILKRVGEFPGFEFHAKCRSIGLNHMYFADDMLLFCKGNYQSVMLLLRGMETFTNASGLQANAGKSNIFSANMDPQSLEDICAATEYQRGNLPFRYLGVPVSAKRINIVDCEILIDKLSARVKAWSSRSLSYAGKVQLINSVILHIHSYWSSMFILPKKVMKRLTAICRNFLWDGKEETRKVPLIAWDLVCKPKNMGGLGVINCIVWNEAAVAKYV
ncbi:hypothetical protein RND71_006699 [Anisodus tanguticus]|uniref:Reverse transcriptase domain-containing protein n=1 Tax=Anisodus tanguticus TaxID=243964 RepID=A0AAE1SVJ6_9SOLA|nr:hypothetical protein RND71_006699 [Anisodus tanguticus]